MSEKKIVYYEGKEVGYINDIGDLCLTAPLETIVEMSEKPYVSLSFKEVLNDE